MHPPLMETYKRYPIKIVKGKGSWVWDEKGKKYLDFTSGIAVLNLGHVPQEVKEMLQQQLDAVWHTSNLFHIPSQEELAKKLTEVSFADQVFFCNSGTEANEGAIKLARLYAHKILGKKGSEIITFTHSFHGRTLGSLSATAQEHLQKGFEPLLEGFRYLPYNDMEALNELVGENTIAVMLEFIQGEGGVIPAEEEWLKKLYTIVKENGLLLIADEVQTGMGRTGSLFAYEEYHIEPDIITLAKGLGSGFPIGAILAKKEVAAAFTPGTHGSTFGGNPLSTTAGLATLKVLTREGFLDEVKRKSQMLKEGLLQLEKKFSFLTVRGKGFLLGIQPKGDVGTFITMARERGVLLLTAGSGVIRILPPLTVTEEEIKEFLQVMEEIFAAYALTMQGV
ncbi:N-acetylornithine aminotransferase [[Clostridium] ultunense Esp]|nr:N-acetylornithine aminotransferase [[Clostridium] ultunense Esp]